MKSLEALFTLVMVTSFSLLLLAVPPSALNPSLYHYQLAGDVWRVWYLRGDLEGFDKPALNADAEEITALTGLCIYTEEEDVASCLGEQRLVAIRKKAWVSGEIRNVTVVLASP